MAKGVDTNRTGVRYHYIRMDTGKAINRTGHDIVM